MFVPDQPLRFKPTFRPYRWGGRRLASRLGKSLPNDGIWAESWEIVDHREAESQVQDGPLAGKTIRELISTFPWEMTGNNRGSERFPLLFKYLDCTDVLSVQVHPDDAYGAKMPIPDRGKTEAWYVIEAEPGSVLYAGLKPGVRREDLVRATERGETQHCLEILNPKAGDCVFIPAGTLHALGAGLLVAEIQQSSDCTFRLFDWNRVDAEGKSRDLHINQALDVIDFESGPCRFVDPSPADQDGWRELVDCDKFSLLTAKSPVDPSSRATPFAIRGHRASILSIPVGSGRLSCGMNQFDLQCGETLFLPYALHESELVLSAGSVALLSRLPRS